MGKIFLRDKKMSVRSSRPGGPIVNSINVLQSFFSSKMRIKLLRLFMKNSEKAYYLRQVSKVLGEPLTPTRRELLNLMRVGLLKRRKVANLIYYEINKEFIVYPELKSMIKKTELIDSV